MRNEVITLYDNLVPADQTVIDCLLLILSNKDIEIKRLTKHISDMLTKQYAERENG